LTGRLVLDWDGTVTVRDTLWMTLERFGDPEVFERVEAQLVRGEISYRELMEVEMATIHAPLAVVNAFLGEEARVRPGFRELAERRRPVVLSSGFRELIEPLLEREGVQLDVVANSIDPRPEGWRVRWNDDAPCPECGDLCKRRSLPPAPVVYAGDGYSDRCAALAASRVFARGDLATWLAEQGLPFEPLTDFHALEARLQDAGGGKDSSPPPQNG
jgi:2-hydroxy-3-keto-5-methylthiopentenyl-1-phosphate phosphatase